MAHPYDDLNHAVTLAYHAWDNADKKWQRLLEREFGHDAGDVRYTAKGRGEEGSVLRDAYNDFAHWREEYFTALAVYRACTHDDIADDHCQLCGDKVTL